MKIKSKIFSIIISIAMALSISMPCCFAETKTNNHEILKPKTNVEKKSETKDIFKKFLISMLWVAGSCTAIFLILLAYKRFKSAQLVNTKLIDIEKNLNSPETVEDAAKFVIEKF